MSEKLLTREEAAAFLRVSLPAIDKFVRLESDPLPALKVGRRFVFVREDLIEWGRQQAAAALGTAKPATKPRRKRA